MTTQLSLDYRRRTVFLSADPKGGLPKYHEPMVDYIRTTIELTPWEHAQAKADARLPEGVINFDPVSGFPSIDAHLGHVITSEDVARLLDED